MHLSFSRYAPSKLDSHERSGVSGSSPAVWLRRIQQSEFRTSCQNIAVDIIQIDRIQNLKLWESYSVKKKAVDRKYPNVVNERTLFHGTTCEIAEQVKKLGFNRSFCGRNATLYGKGTYFAKNAQYSCNDTYSRPSDQGNKYMFQAQVITGKLSWGTRGHPKALNIRYLDLTYRLESGGVKGSGRIVTEVVVEEEGFEMGT
uniref:Poly [ADP-ribose] polymerase n=1 Tax=Callorhinchus milii TaxID=7868 RepID=A0A4W3HZ60_CALMI